MTILRTLGLSAAGLLLALAAAAQTPAAPRAKRTPAADSPRGATSKGNGYNVYAAPGEPVIVRDSDKPLHYDGPAAGHAAKAAEAASRTKQTAAPASRAVPAADSPRGTSSNGNGYNVYAAPGEPVIVKDNGKNTPPYDGPAAGHDAGTGRTKTTLATPK